MFSVYNDSKPLVNLDGDPTAFDDQDYQGARKQLLGSTDDEPMSTPTNHQEAYYLYFVAILGLLLNCTVVLAVLLRRNLRKLTSAFLIHACFLDFLKAAYCIPIGNNLLTQREPSDCSFFAASYIVIITMSVFNMVAMVCTEAYTFGETNIGGDSRGSLCCIIFGIILVYISSTTLHLGPTLIGGHFEFQKEIGNCSFKFGEQTGYIAHVMWISIITLALIGEIHFICKLYKEIQVNQPNRVSMLVRTSITIMDDPGSATYNIRTMVKDSIHRAKIFVLGAITFVVCWYPLFFLILIDKQFQVSPKVYQAFSFIAWSQGSIQPVLYICFDRQLNLLAKYIYCDKYRRMDMETISHLMHTRRESTTSPQELHTRNEDIESGGACREDLTDGYGSEDLSDPSPLPISSDEMVDQERRLSDVQC